jgi:histidinol-phosphatase
MGKTAPVLSDLDLAHRCADAADAVTSRFFAARSFGVVTKADGTPVTEADLQTEQAVKALLVSHRPGDGVLGEEVGESAPDGGPGPATRRWVLDGIDGTHNFVAGRTEWGTMIALQDDGEVVLGMVTSPALGRRWWATRGGGAWTATIATVGELVGEQARPGTAERGPAERIGATATADLGDAVVVAIPPTHRCQGWKRDVAEALERGDVRATSFAHAAVRVATGAADAALFLAGGPWDLAAGIAIVEEAGGRFCDAWGGRRIDTRTAVLSNAGLFDELAAVMATARPAEPEAMTVGWSVP